MIANSIELVNPDPRRWLPEQPAWRKLPVEWGMRAAGRMAACLNGAFGSRAAGRLGILTYHRVIEPVAGFPYPLHNVEPQSMIEQLGGLLRRGFQFLPLRRALAAAERGEALPERAVVVTFDDGFATVYANAWPILQRFGIPATVFVSTAYLDSDGPFPFDAWGVANQRLAPIASYRPLRTAECHEMIESGLIDLGAHTHTHEDFRGRPEAFFADLAVSVNILRERFRVDDVTFAFPYGCAHRGFTADDLVNSARAAGVTCGLTTAPKLVDLFDSPFRWGRFNVFSWDSSATLTAKLGDWYTWAPRARKAVARTFGFGPARTNPQGVTEKAHSGVMELLDR